MARQGRAVYLLDGQELVALDSPRDVARAYRGILELVHLYADTHLECDEEEGERESEDGSL